MSGRLDRLREGLRAVARIARWEARRSVGVVDRQTAILGFVALLLAGAVGGAAMATGGVALDRDVYRVGVDDDSPYHEVVRESPALAAQPPDIGRLGREVEVVVSDGRVYVADSKKARAALSTFRSAVRSRNLQRMREEPNESAAFPVVVTLQYVERGPDGVVASGDGGGSGGRASDGDGGVNSGTSDGSDDGGAGTGSGGSDGGGNDGFGAAASGSTGDGPLGVPGFGGVAGGLLGGGTSGSPADISPPFPFGALVLAFVFFIPMNFVIQPYGSTVLNERINRRGELLLVAPVSPTAIVAGKTLPYLATLVGITAVVALAIGGGPVSVAAVAPIATLYLAATFVGGMFARSFKELTFVTVSISVFLTSYAFVPAIFTNVTPIALISPLTLVVHDLQGTGVTAAEYVFSTGPFYVGSAVCFLLGIGVYREEDMFTQRPVPLKFLDALNSRITGRRSVAVLSALSIPFVFIAELLAIAVLFVLPVEVSVPLLLVAVAAVEEVAKSVHVYAGFRGPFAGQRGWRTALVLGALSGLGFFVGEKLTAIVQFVGLPNLTLGRAAFSSAGIAATPALGLLLLLAPLALHATTTSIAALGATRNRSTYLAALVPAVAVHAAYNLAVVSTLG
ncbi:ABC transporter permease [Haloplanus rubicundus]|uniref:ABC transporter permease n=1 Tax=Haloplanus rubicundus TaxID=1547898 RepID=A0A345E4Z0_9EURY|nr:PrsW family glutamic-type intramembrane protease [Haloplanus rubicundus]AXG07262.1 ABC transporter permease [Haloplanus rubicundus]